MEETTEKKEVSTKKIAGIVILAAIIFGAGAYMYATNDTAQEKETVNKQVIELQEDAAEAKKTDKITDSSVDTADWKTYKNTQYGFSLTLNDLWKNYSIVDRKPDLDRDGEITMSWIESYLYVCVPTTSEEWLDEKTGTFCPFAITIVKADKFEEYKEDMGDRLDHIVDRNSSYVFLYGNAMEGPSDGDAVINDSSNIISTFKLIQ